MSGKKIYAKLLESGERMAAIRALGNTDIYALVRHIFRQELEATDTGSLICGMAHVAVMERYLAREQRAIIRKAARQEQAARDCAGAMGEGHLP